MWRNFFSFEKMKMKMKQQNSFRQTIYFPRPPNDVFEVQLPDISTRKKK